MAYFTGTPPETWAPTRFHKLKFRGVAGSGANAPVEEIMSKRADIAPIDNVAWPNLAEAGEGPDRCSRKVTAVSRATKWKRDRPWPSTRAIPCSWLG